MDCSLPGSSVYGISQPRMLEKGVISFSRWSSLPRNWTCVSCIAGGFFTVWATREALMLVYSEVAQSCPTLSDPMDCSPPGSSVHGIFQARILEWVTISFSRRPSQPRDRTQVPRIAGRCFIVWATREVLCNFSLFLLLLWLSQISSCFHYILITIEISIFSI